MGPTAAACSCPPGPGAGQPGPRPAASPAPAGCVPSHTSATAVSRMSGRECGPVTPGASRPTLLFHFQEPLPTLIPVSRDCLSTKAEHSSKANAGNRLPHQPGRNVSSPCPSHHVTSAHLSPQPVQGHPHSQWLLPKDFRGLWGPDPTSVMVASYRTSIPFEMPIRQPPLPSRTTPNLSICLWPPSIKSDSKIVKPEKPHLFSISAVISTW